MRMIMALVAVAFVAATAVAYPVAAAERCGNFEDYPGWAHDAFCRGQQGGG